jgi:hypothetical protein
MISDKTIELMLLTAVEQGLIDKVVQQFAAPHELRVRMEATLRAAIRQMRLEQQNPVEVFRDLLPKAGYPDLKNAAHLDDMSDWCETKVDLRRVYFRGDKAPIADALEAIINMHNLHDEVFQRIKGHVVGGE